MKTVFVNSGHFRDDSGVVVGQYKENELCKIIRDELAKMIGEALYVPDELNLKDSIAWVKKNGWKTGDLCLDLHLNAHNNNQIRGTEVYHYNNEKIANVFARYVSSSLDIQNRGAIPDTNAAVGSLGWCRQLNGLVIEICYLTNFMDRAKLTQGIWQKNAAEGIAGAIGQLQNDIPALEKQVSLLTQLVNALRKVLELLQIKKLLGGIFKKW